MQHIALKELVKQLYAGTYICNMRNDKDFDYVNELSQGDKEMKEILQQIYDWYNNESPTG